MIRVSSRLSKNVIYFVDIRLLQQVRKTTTVDIRLLLQVRKTTTVDEINRILAQSAGDPNYPLSCRCIYYSN